MGYNSGKVLASLSIDSGSKRTATLIYGTATGAAASTTLGTVPAGKVWRIIAMNLSGLEVSTSGNTAQLLLNDVQALTVALMGTATTNNTGTASLNFSYTDCPVLSVGQTVKVTSNAANAVSHANVYYYEESA
jgi:hypothetical protein